MIGVCHCTGQTAFLALAKAIGYSLTRWERSFNFDPQMTPIKMNGQ